MGLNIFSVVRQMRNFSRKHLSSLLPPHEFCQGLLQRLLCFSPAVLDGLLLCLRPSPFNCVGVCSSCGIDKCSGVINIKIDVPMLIEVDVGTPFICNHCSSCCNILLDYRQKGRFISAIIGKHTRKHKHNDVQRRYKDWQKVWCH